MPPTNLICYSFTIGTPRRRREKLPKLALWLPINWSGLNFDRHRPGLSGGKLSWFFGGTWHGVLMSKEWKVIIVGGIARRRVKCYLRRRPLVTYVINYKWNVILQNSGLTGNQMGLICQCLSGHIFCRNVRLRSCINSGLLVCWAIWPTCSSNGN